MIKQNRRMFFVSLLLTLAVIISSFAATGGAQQQDETEQPAQGEQQAGTDIGSGNQGAFIPSAIDTSNLRARNIHRDELGWVNGEVIRRAVLLEALDETGNTIDNPNIRTYVFFKLNNRDLRSWNNGELKILWRPVDDGRNWQECNAFAVDVQGSQQAIDQEITSQPRLACLTSQYNAYYALVRTE